MPFEYAFISYGGQTLVEDRPLPVTFAPVIQKLSGSAARHDSQASYQYQNMQYSMMVENEILYIVVADSRMKVISALKLISDIQHHFKAAMTGNPNTYPRPIELTPHRCGGFAPKLRDLVRTYSDNPDHNNKMVKLKTDIEVVKTQMMDNLDAMVKRGGDVERLCDQTQLLEEDAHKFERRSKKLSDLMFWRNVKIVIAIVVVIFLFSLIVSMIACSPDFSKCKSDSNEREGNGNPNQHPHHPHHPHNRRWSGGLWGLTKNDTYGMLDIPARRMWGWGSNPKTGATLPGFCGSMSFQMAGIFFGNYLSEEKIRASTDGIFKEVLIANNSNKTAINLHYTFQQWDWQNTSTPQNIKFINWAKSHIDEGHPVISGWFEKEPDGDPDYDHIMPIVGYTSSPSAFGQQVTGIIHYDLYQNRSLTATGNALGQTRQQCYQAQRPVQPYTYCLPLDYDYGIAITGIVDPNEELFRTQLVMPSWKEPDYAKENGQDEEPVVFQLFAVISGLTPGNTYTILRFDSPASVPNSNFKQGSYGDKQSFVARGRIHQVELAPVMSNGTWFYRTVYGTV